MALYLFELTLDAPDRAAVTDTLDAAVGQLGRAGGDLIESQVTGDLSRAYLVVEAGDCSTLTLDPAGLAAARSVTGPDEVRLVGAGLAELKQARGTAGYLVEWQIPEDLGMADYLARKKARAPLYAQVPEVTFLRTYVREDTSKCLCLYDGPDEASVRKAREVVSTPISSLFPLDQGQAR
jgi:hypothetical protein